MLKLSGEAFANAQGFGFDKKRALHITEQIKQIIKKKHQLIIVCGAGNIFRGKERKQFDIAQYRADEMGMLSTLINALFLEQVLKLEGMKAMVLNSFSNPFVESYTIEKAEHLLKANHLVLCSGGLGHPFFTTDSLAALRACELKVDLLLKATTVDGIYDKDPKKYSGAKKFETIDFDKTLSLGLEVMDQTAFALLRGKKIDICVFDLFKKDAIINAIEHKKIGTRVKGC